ncbi:MAG: cyclic-phosphate processing receiver domain-containing protein, partial [Candidatus Thorarchaeota archaeon]
MKKVLFLDDSRERISDMMKTYNPKTEELFIATTAMAAIQYLMDEEFYLAMLDHDLEGPWLQNSDDTTSGMAVVRWIVNRKPKIEKIVVHSWNIEAGKEMVAKLTDVGYDAVYRPFEPQFNPQFDVMPQPAPVGEGDKVWRAVVKDMKARNKFGTAKYGTPLKTFNGRNALIDAYQECLD